MPKMTGYELYDKMKIIDNKVKVCFVSATYVNYEAAREVFPFLKLECFIQKPVEIDVFDKKGKCRTRLGNKSQVDIENIVSYLFMPFIFLKASFLSLSRLVVTTLI